MDVNGAPNIDTQLYSLTFKANSFNYGKLDYYNPSDVVKFKDDKFNVPWKNINSKKQALAAQRSAPSSAMTIISLLNDFMGLKENTTSRPIYIHTPIIKYPESISSGAKILRTAGDTLGEILWGNKGTISLPLTEPNPTVPAPITPSKLQNNEYSLNPLTDGNNLIKLQQHNLIHPGYDYDDTICKVINNRVLCGYNKNLGTIHDEAAFTNLKGDCRLRGDRIECGYSGGTYNLNSDEPYKLTSKSIYQTRADQSQVVNVKPPRTSNQDDYYTLGKLVAMYDIRRNMRSSDLRDGKHDLDERKYEEEPHSLYKYYSLSQDFSRIQYKSKLRALKSEIKSRKIKTTISRDLENDKIT